MQPPATTPAATAPSTTTSVAVVGAVTPSPPVVAVGLDWAVLIPIIATALISVITTTAGLIISYKNGKKSDAIHVLVNSGMTKALADLATAQEEIRTLRELTQSLNARVTGAPTLTAAEVENRQNADESRLPSAAVLAAQASTPKGPTP